MNDNQSCEIKIKNITIPNYSDYINATNEPKCQILINFYADEKTTSIPKYSQKHIISEETVNFENDTIKIDSLNSSTGILKIYININGEKVKSENENDPNFYTILLKNIEIKNEFQDFNYKIVNNIEINLSIKVKNIIGGGGLAARMNMFKKKNYNNEEHKVISTGASIKDRLKFLNQSKTESKNIFVPNKIKLPTELTDKLMKRNSVKPLVNQNKETNKELENNKKRDNKNVENIKENKVVEEKNNENDKIVNSKTENKKEEEENKDIIDKDVIKKEIEEEQKINNNKEDIKNELEKEYQEEETEKNEENTKENKDEEQETINENEDVNNEKENEIKNEEKKEKIEEENEKIEEQVKENIKNVQLEEKEEKEEEKEEKETKEEDKEEKQLEEKENKEEEKESKEEEKENKEEEKENKEEEKENKEEEKENKEEEKENKEEEKENTEENIEEEKENKEENIEEEKENKVEEKENKEEEKENIEEEKENKEEEKENKEEEKENIEEEKENKEENIEEEKKNKEEEKENKEENIEEEKENKEEEKSEEKEKEKNLEKEEKEIKNEKENEDKEQNNEQNKNEEKQNILEEENNNKNEISKNENYIEEEKKSNKEKQNEENKEEQKEESENKENEIKEQNNTEKTKKEINNKENKEEEINKKNEEQENEENNNDKKEEDLNLDKIEEDKREQTEEVKEETKEEFKELKIDKIKEEQKDENENEINEIKEEEIIKEQNRQRKNNLLKRSFCIKSNRFEEIEKEKEKEKKEKEKEKKEKQREKESNMDKKLNDLKRGSCMLPKLGFKNVISNIEKKEKTESKVEPKKVIKKLDTNKLNNMFAQRLIGQVAKKPNELLKKKEEPTPSPSVSQEISIRPSLTSAIISQEQKELDPTKLYKSGTVMFEKEMEIYNQSMKKDTTITSKERDSTKRHSSLASNFGFEVLDSFEDSKLNSTANTSTDNNSINEGFLDSINYEDYLSDLKQQGIKESPRETFCEGFFIASFPKIGGKVIENSSEKLPASCGHPECSKLPSMKPEIIMRYPLKDTKNLELNNLAATICFPTGIKLCYSENKIPEKIKEYVTQITNQKGERYYMRTFHFYHKMQNIDFTKEYEIHPLKHHLMKFGDKYTILSEAEFTDEIVNNIQQNLEFCQNLGFRDIVYIPYCICLISKYPYNKELGACLNSIYKILSQEPNKLPFEINDLIMYLIHSIPIPIKNMKIRFFIPYYEQKLELACPKVDDVISSSNLTKLFDYLSVDNIIIVFRLLLSEKKILFIHDDYTELSYITNTFITLLYPFKWVHTYIPIMSDQMLKYLETFLPFLNGIHKSLMKFVEDVFKEGEIEDSDEVFLIYIKKGEPGEINLSSSLKKSKVKFSKYLQNNVLPLPFEKELKKELKSIESLRKVQIQRRESKIHNNTDQALEDRMRDAFIDIFVKMFQDYEKYIGILDDDVVFNKVLFMNSINKDAKFYDEFVDCQLFQQFTQNILKDNCSYFNKKIKEAKEKEKDKKSKKNEKNQRTSSIIKQESVYIAKPDYLGIKENDRNAIETTIKENYQKDNVETPELRNKILETITPIVPEKYINSNCIIYLTPEKKETVKEDENNNKLQKIKVGINNTIKTNNTVLSSGELSEKQIDKIKDDIKDMVIKIFKSQIGTDIKALKTEAFRNLEYSYGRAFFISLISNNNNNIISLQENSFNFLDTLIYGTLTSILKLEETDQIIEEVAILIKSTKFFQKEPKKESKKDKTKKNPEILFDYLKKKLISYNKLNQTNLWQKWFELDLQKKEEDEQDEQDNDEIKKELILKVCKEMMEFEIDKTFIKKVCDIINKSVFEEGSEMHEKAKKEYIYLISTSTYIVKAKA